MNIFSRCSKVSLHNDKFNAREVNYNQEVYAFDVRTRVSVAANMCGTLKRTIRPEHFKPIVSDFDCTSLPSSKNWVFEGKVTPVQDQERCNSDYIFAPAASIESHAAIKGFAAPVKLSEQQMIECIDKEKSRGGCNKGMVEWVWNDAIKEGGVVASATYNPWSGDDSGACKKGLPKAPNTRVASWVKLPVANEETLKCHLANVGPIVCSLDFSEVIMSYKSGIYDDPAKAHCNSSIYPVGKYFEMAMPYNHAMLVVRRT